MMMARLSSVPGSSSASATLRTCGLLGGVRGGGRLQDAGWAGGGTAARPPVRPSSRPPACPPVCLLSLVVAGSELKTQYLNNLLLCE